MAPEASLKHPYSLCFAPPGSGLLCYVADAGNQLIRAVALDGSLSTLAGSGQRGSSDGQGSEASFECPSSILLEPLSGSLLVCDHSNNRIRSVTPGGLVSTVAGSGRSASIDGAGLAASLSCPRSMALLPSSGLIVVSEWGSHKLRLLDPLAGYAVSTLAGSGREGCADGPASLASFCRPRGLTVAPDGSIYCTDSGNHAVRAISPEGLVSTLAGCPGSSGSAGGQGSAACFSSPSGICCGPEGELYVADTLNHVIRLVQ